MSPFTIAKLALMLVAAVLLAWGIRTDDSAIRWAGILMATPKFFFSMGRR